MNKTSIEWVKNPDGSQGYTLNSKTGCENHNNGFCKGGGFPCYAYRLAHGRLKQRYWANHQIAIPDGHRLNDLAIEAAYNDPFYPRFWPDRLNGIPKVRMMRGFPWEPDRKGIFLDDMSDWMGDYWPEEWTRLELEMIRANPQHRIYTLTKQPQNLPKWSPFPENCWVGVTVTNSDAMIKFMQARGLYTGKGSPDAWFNTKIFLSFEPLLSDMKDAEIIFGALSRMFEMAKVFWVIIGAQTKPYRPPLKIWIDEITEACKKANIPYFLKDNLRLLLGDDLVQDMPKGVEIDH